MNGLEIALLVFGFACIVVSFFIVDNNERVEKGKPNVALPDTKAFNELSKKVISDTNNNAERVLSETEEKLEALSNDKIMAVGEYSDQIIEKIDTNHKEVVFLYQMLKDKEEELKSTAQELENVRIECEKLIREKEVLEKEVPAATNAPVVNSSAEDNYLIEETSENASENTKSSQSQNTGSKKNNKKTSGNGKKTSVLSNAQSERQYGWGEALALAEEQQDSADNISERNQEIIELYKQKKSVLEISKLLGMGQGEVKLVIDLYCK